MARLTGDALQPPVAVPAGDVIEFDETLARAWAQVPPDYRLLPAWQHHPCDQGTGLISIVERLNTKWRQRQSGLVRRACGVHPQIEGDLFERFRLLVDEHSRQGARQRRLGA